MAEIKKWVIRIDRAQEDTSAHPAKTVYLNIMGNSFKFSGCPTMFDSKQEAKSFMDHPQFNTAFLMEAQDGDSAGIYYRTSRN